MPEERKKQGVSVLHEKAIEVTRDVLIEYLQKGLYCDARDLSYALERLVQVRDRYATGRRPELATANDGPPRY